jgi:putative ABC transport system permease protein
MSRFRRQAGDALRSLRADRARTLLMMSGVAAAVAVLASVMMIGAGTRARVLETVQKHGLDMIMVRAGGDVQVFAPRADRGLSSLFLEDARAIEAQVPGVVMASGVQNQRGITVVANERSVVTRGFGVEPQWIDIRRWGMAEGEFLTDADVSAMARVVMLGARVSRELFPTGGAVGSTVRVNGDPYAVKGVFIEMGASAGGDDWDDRIVVPISTATRRLFGRPFLEQVVLRVDDARRVAATAQSIRELLRVRHQVAAGAPDDFFVREPEDVEGAALESSTSLVRLQVGIGLVALVAGGVVLLNLMLLSVSHRRHEIGLRRAVGARRGDVGRQFLIESLVVALVGGTAGLALAAVAAPVMNALDLGHARPGVMPFALSFLACAIVGVLAGILPARRAVRVDPATTLRERPL